MLCLSSTSNSFASSLISWEVNAVPSSHVILEGMFECLRKIETIARATMSASPFIRVEAERYFEKTSIPERMYV